MDELESKTRALNILIVEDSEFDIKITFRAFENSSYDTKLTVVRDGQEALEYLQDDTNDLPDLVLLDINLPKINGFGVLRSIKETAELKKIPVVMLSSSKNQEDISKSYEEGAASYIQKPVDYDEFVHVVEGFNQYWQKINQFPTSEN